MSELIGYTVIEWNQAGGSADIPEHADLNDDLEEARHQREWFAGNAAMAGRRDRYEVVSVYRDDEGDDL